MRSAMTLWTAPGLKPWQQRHRVVQLALCANLARHHYPPLVLFTDPDGAAFVQRFGIPFSELNTDWLPFRLKDADTRLWCLGKIAAYQQLALRGESFIHLDNDAFLFERLPARIETAGVFAQSPEKFYLDDGPAAACQHFRWVYRIKEMARAIALWPDARTLASRPVQQAVNMGCFGGNDTKTIGDYAHEALQTFHDHPRNRRALDRLFNQVDSFFFTCVVEQWMLGASLARNRAGVHYLLDVYRPGAHFSEIASARDNGYVHLWGQAKDYHDRIAWCEAELGQRDPELLSRINAVFARCELEDEVRRDHLAWRSTGNVRHAS